MKDPTSASLPLTELPTTFQVANVPYKIEYVTQLRHEQGTLGYCDMIGQTIKIQTVAEGIPMGREQLQVTLWHEILHAIFYAMGFNSEEHEEKHIDGMAYYIAQVMETLA